MFAVCGDGTGGVLGRRKMTIRFVWQKEYGSV